jgi:uncharacterized membrane protein YsdA (DUF1294 family)
VRPPNKAITLHLVALLGRWPGAALAQKRLRHKSSKIEFRRVFWATVALNCMALGWLMAHADGIAQGPLAVLKK